MKRILCLIDSLGPGGAQRQLVGLATFLKERGCDCDCLSRQPLLCRSTAICWRAIRISEEGRKEYDKDMAYSQETYMRTVFPKLENKIVTIPNFVDLDHFVPPLERRRREVPEIMIAASIWPSKNTVGFIDAVAKLKEKGHKFHISWYGLNTKHIEYIN